MSNILRVGDTVNWKGSWGKDATKQVKVTAIEKDCVGKNGTNVNEVPWDYIEGRNVIVDLDNSHWAYGYQISPIENDNSIFEFGGIGFIMN